MRLLLAVKAPLVPAHADHIERVERVRCREAAPRLGTPLVAGIKVDKRVLVVLIEALTVLSGEQPFEDLVRNEKFAPLLRAVR